MAILGSNSIGGSSASTGNAYGSKFTATEDGILTKITAYTKASSGTMSLKAMIYSDNAGSPDQLLVQQKVETTGIGTTAGWYDIQMNSFLFKSGVTYWICFHHSASAYIYWGSGSAGQYQFVASSGSGYTTLPNPADSDTQQARALSIYATYNTVTDTSSNNTSQVLALSGDTTNYLEIPDDDSLSIDITTGFTVSFWVKRTVDLFTNSEDDGANGTYVMMFGKGGFHDTNNLEWGFRYYSNDGTRANLISFYMFDLDGGLGAGGRTDTAPDINTWVHIVGRVDQTYIKIFMDGVEQAVYDNWVTYPITPGNGDEPMRIGTMTKSSFFEGEIDDVRIYGNGLSNAEIQEITDAGRSGVAPDAGLIHRYKFDGDYNDEIGSLDGTLYGGSIPSTNKFFFT